MYLDLGRTQVFVEQWDALVFFTGCDQGAPAENEIEAKTPGNCSAYIKQRTMVVDGRSVLDRPFRREIYLRARARGLDTLQFTPSRRAFLSFRDCRSARAGRHGDGLVRPSASAVCGLARDPPMRV